MISGGSAIILCFLALYWWTAGARMAAQASGGYGGGYGMKCSNNLAPLAGSNNQPKPCQEDASCGVDTHYCQPNRLHDQPGICCQYCPCGSPPLPGDENKPVECETDVCCSDTNYYCNKLNITGKTDVCCPRGPDGTTPPAPQPPQPEVTTPIAEPQPTMTTADYVPPPTTTVGYVPTTTAGYIQTTTAGYVPTTTASGGPVQDAATPAAGSSSPTWQSMFSEHKNQNPSFAIPPNADSFWSNNNGAAVVPTSGQFKPCTKNADCYTDREPNEWCKSQPEYNWVGVGCVCVKDAQNPSCIITREKVSNKQKQWTFCKSEATFQCT